MTHFNVSFPPPFADWNVDYVVKLVKYSAVKMNVLSAIKLPHSRPELLIGSQLIHKILRVFISCSYMKVFL